MKTRTSSKTINDLNAILDIEQNLTGKSYLKALIKNTARILNIKYVLVGKSTGPDNRQVKTEIVWADTDFGDNFVYDLKGTPCDNVLSGNRVCVFPNEVASQFPEDTLLKEMGVSSYIGAPIITPEEELSSLLVLLDDKPIINVDYFKSIIDFLAMRASTEMERYKIEESLKQRVSEQTVELETANEKLQNVLEDLEESIAAKNRFFSIIAHDLRSPFIGLIGFTEMVMNNFENFSKDDLKGIFKEINSSGNILYNLLENLLHWSMTQTGSLPFNPKRYNLNKLVNEVLLILEQNARVKDIELEVVVSEGVYAEFDIDMLKSALRNLLSNAIKYSHPGSRVTLEVIKENDFTHVSVIDRGKGIKPEDLEKIFQIENIHSTQGTAGESGTGLGLILAKEYVEKNGGQIRVESEPGKGSRFSFAIPVVL